MPNYDFVCEKCKKSFTVRLKVSEYGRKNVRCPKCNSKKLRQQITSFQTITSKKT